MFNFEIMVHNSEKKRTDLECFAITLSRLVLFSESFADSSKFKSGLSDGCARTNFRSYVKFPLEM